jgi:hypothetical protein
MAEIGIARAFTDQRLLGAALVDAASWEVWRTVLKAAWGITLSEEEAKTFVSIAGGRKPPRQRVRELWAIIGRRSGKSRIAAAIAVYLALFVKHRLARGERGMVLVLAASQAQARTVFDYVKGFLEASPALSKEVANRTSQEITLRNGIVIAIHSSSFRTVRGRTLLAAIFDEVAFWRDESSALPDVEAYRAIMPSLATTAATAGMLIGISTPYRKLGLLYGKYREHYGVDDERVLVVQGSTQQFNPSLADEEITAQRSADPTAAASEWDAEFRTDISSYLDDASVEAAIEYGRPLEIPFAGRQTFYKAFTDSSGGTGNDSYTLAIGHREKGNDGRYIIDLVRGTQPGQVRDPQVVTQEYATLLAEYRIREVTGDYYSAGWVENAWAKCGIRYIKSALSKSDIYLEVIPLFTRGLVRLPEHPKLIRELRLLERHTHRSGRDSVDHGRSGSDDHANAVAGVLRELSNHLGYDHRNFLERDEQGNLLSEEDAWRRLNTQIYLMSGGTQRLW